MKLDLIRLPTISGGSVVALDYEPRRPRGVTLAMGHGYSSSKHNLDPLCAFLASHGYRVISVDFPGHKLGCSGGRLDSIEDLVDALGAAVAHARATEGGVVYAAGHSMGATTALRTAAADASIAGAIAIATGAGRPAGLKALGALGAVDLRSSYVDGLTLPEMAEAVEAALEKSLPFLAGRPVLYVAADRDAMVSKASATELFDRAPEPKAFVTISSDHTYAGENARAAILEWLNQRHPRA